MPDVFANMAGAPLPVLEMIANVLELRASMPPQQEMQRTYLRDIDFPEGAKVLDGPSSPTCRIWSSKSATAGR